MVALRLDRLSNYTRAYLAGLSSAAQGGVTVPYWTALAEKVTVLARAGATRVRKVW